MEFTIFAILRYLEKGKTDLYLLTIVTALHFATRNFVYLYAHCFFPGILLYAAWARTQEMAQLVLTDAGRRDDAAHYHHWPGSYNAVAISPVEGTKQLRSRNSGRQYRPAAHSNR